MKFADKVSFTQTRCPWLFTAVFSLFPHFSYKIGLLATHASQAPLFRQQSFGIFFAHYNHVLRGKAAQVTGSERMNSGPSHLKNVDQSIARMTKRYTFSTSQSDS